MEKRHVMVRHVASNATQTTRHVGTLASAPTLAATTLIAMLRIRSGATPEIIAVNVEKD